MKHVLITFILLYSLNTFSVHASELNAGFVEGLWYSQETVFADTPTRIYVAFRNNTEHDLTGTIRFSDNNKRIGTSEVSALSGRLVEAWVDWKPTYGDHTIVATLNDATIHVIGSGPQPATVANVSLEESLFVDYDTDTDGIGNKTDTDDDGDGVSDEDESTRGSDPLIPNLKPIDTQTLPKDSAPEESRQSVTTNENDSPPASKSQPVGLERYTEDGFADTLLSNVTNKVVRAKDSLDSYRNERNDIRSGDFETATNPENGTTTQKSTATITRSQIETKKSLAQSIVDGLNAIIRGVWTLILFIISNALAHPVFIQLFLLFFILYILYRILRRLGRRRY